MSQFDTLYGRGPLSTLVGKLGDAVRYHQADIEPISLQAVLGNEEITEDDTERGLMRRRVRYAFISTDPSSPFGGVANPRDDGEVEIDGERWAIEVVERVSGTTARLMLIRPEARERTKQGYRTPR